MAFRFRTARKALPSIKHRREYIVKTGLIVILSTALLAASAAQAQVGSLIWQENFDNLDNWIKVTGNGSWGWGNGELEFYPANKRRHRGRPRRAGQQGPAHHRQAGERPGHRRSVGQPAQLHVGQGDDQVVRLRQVRHDRGPRPGAEPQPGRLARRLAAGHGQLRLAPLRRDRHDGDGLQARPSGTCTTRTTAATAWTTRP